MSAAAEDMRLTHSFYAAGVANATHGQVIYIGDYSLKRGQKVKERDQGAMTNDTKRWFRWALGVFALSLLMNGAEFLTGRSLYGMAAALLLPLGVVFLMSWYERAEREQTSARTIDQ